ncbi:hypothetical protein [Desulfogranum japonicum]|nr:hypothetical protein [Desulfogranum japonicum]
MSYTLHLDEYLAIDENVDAKQVNDASKAHSKIPTGIELIAEVS